MGCENVVGEGGYLVGELFHRQSIYFRDGVSLLAPNCYIYYRLRGDMMWIWSETVVYRYFFNVRGRKKNISADDVWLCAGQVGLFVSQRNISPNGIPQLATKRHVPPIATCFCDGTVNADLITDMVRRLLHWAHGWEEGSTRKTATRSVTKITCR